LNLIYVDSGAFGGLRAGDLFTVDNFSWFTVTVGLVVRGFAVSPRLLQKFLSVYVLYGTGYADSQKDRFQYFHLTVE
jgi:hypothetical protein